MAISHAYEMINRLQLIQLNNPRKHKHSFFDNDTTASIVEIVEFGQSIYNLQLFYITILFRTIEKQFWSL